MQASRSHGQLDLQAFSLLGKWNIIDDEVKQLIVDADAPVATELMEDTEIQRPKRRIQQHQSVGRVLVQFGEEKV